MKFNEMFNECLTLPAPLHKQSHLQRPHTGPCAKALKLFAAAPVDVFVIFVQIRRRRRLDDVGGQGHRILA